MPRERDDDFRCYGCEANIGRPGWCGECRKDRKKLDDDDE